MSDWVIILAFVYAVGIVWGLICGSVAYGDPGCDEEKRMGARLILFCWAWPVLALMGICIGIKNLWKEAWK